MDGLEVLDYDDARRHVRKRLCMQGKQLLAVRLFGEDGTRDWLRELLLSGTDVDAYRHALLAPKVPPDMAAWSRSRGICACTGVNEEQLRHSIAAGNITLSQIAQDCGAGGECGSCKPEIMAMIRLIHQEAS